MVFWLFRRRKGGGKVHAPVEPTVIANGVTVEGSIATAGELQIAGAVRGDINAQTCYVDASGSVEGQVSAEEVNIYGQVIGPVFGHRVHVYAAARVEGTIVTATISIENGAFIDGAVRRSDDPLNEAASQRQQDPGSADGAESDNGHAYRPLRALRPR